MIDAEFLRHMARYNAWQNTNVFRAADGLADDTRRANQGAFFGSIHETLSHLLWGDTVWMSRFADWQKPSAGLGESRHWVSDWHDLTARRRTADQGIKDWAEPANTLDFSSDLTWYSGVLRRDVVMPVSVCIVHFFNHQTHHRGQVHAMLTSVGHTPEETDLFAMPADA